jgi:hypothetical protein
LINVPSRTWNFLGLTTTIAPLNDVRVRQAIAYAVPYQTLIQDSLYGFASPVNGILATGTPALDESPWPYQPNPRKAKALLAAAGHGSGVHTTLTVSESRADDVITATYIQYPVRAPANGVQCRHHPGVRRRFPREPERGRAADVHRLLVLLGRRSVLPDVLAPRFGEQDGD